MVNNIRKLYLVLIASNIVEILAIISLYILYISNQNLKISISYVIYVTIFEVSFSYIITHIMLKEKNINLRTKELNSLLEFFNYSRVYFCFIITILNILFILFMIIIFIFYKLTSFLFLSFCLLLISMLFPIFSGILGKLFDYAFSALD